MEVSQNCACVRRRKTVEDPNRGHRDHFLNITLGKAEQLTKFPRKNLSLAVSHWGRQQDDTPVIHTLSDLFKETHEMTTF